jgi:hypothetical protein
MQVSLAVETDIKSNDAVASLIQTIYKMLYKLPPQITLKMYEENLQAVTTVNYAGQIVSVWCESPEADRVDSHLASVQAAFELRAAVVRGVVAIGCALASISVAVANPFTAATALTSAPELKRVVERFAAVALENG